MEEQSKKLLTDLARNLKEYRTSKGVSQEEVLNSCGVHIGRIEQGSRDVSITTLKKLSDYFEISISELTEGL